MTEPAPGTTDAGAIMLHDTRSRPDLTDTLFENTMDTDDDEPAEEHTDRNQSRSTLSTNHAALAIGDDDDVDEEDDEGAVLVGRRRDVEDGQSSREHEGGLSAKVGIILVSETVFLQSPVDFEGREYKTYSL